MNKVADAYHRQERFEERRRCRVEIEADHHRADLAACLLPDTRTRHAVSRLPIPSRCDVVGPVTPFTEDLRHLLLGACQQS
jgi:hypothetical protein